MLPQPEGPDRANNYRSSETCWFDAHCIVSPKSTTEVARALTILNALNTKFAIRSGGHSPLGGAASIKGGILVDLSLLCEVIPSEDGTSVTIGAGAKWMDVSKILDEKGMAVLGGRNSAVGVGGLILGGQFFLFAHSYVSNSVQN